MEEILASIRRIIADDPGRMPRPQKNAASATPAELNATPAKQSRPAPEPARTDPDPIKPLSATISPLRCSEHQARNEARAVPLPDAARTDEESDRDIFAAVENEKTNPALTDEDAKAEQAFAEPDAEEQREEPAEQIDEMETSAPVPRPQEPVRERADAVRHLSRRESEPRLMSADTSRAVDSAFNTLAQTVFVQNGPTLEELVKQMLRPMLKDWLDDNLPQLVERLVRAEIERVSRGR